MFARQYGLFLSVILTVLPVQGALAESTQGFTGTPTASEQLPALRSGILSGGPIYHQADQVIPQLKSSGFNMVMLWTLHINGAGDLVLNDVLLARGGKYVANPLWPALLNSLKTAPSSIDRVEISIGAWSTPDFENVQSIIRAEPDLENSNLYKNFLALRQALPVIDAVSYDDESLYDVDTTLILTRMLAGLGFKITLIPYSNQSFWQALFQRANAEQPGLVDRVYVQSYAGGFGNVPSTWNELFPGIQVDIGLWGRHGGDCTEGTDPTTIRSQLGAWKGSIAGGWLWLLDDVLACAAHYPLNEYAAALKLAGE